MQSLTALKDSKKGKKPRYTFYFQDIPGKKIAQRFLVTCIDFRLANDISRYAEKQKWVEDYDQFVLAGCSLGYCHPDAQFAHWSQTLDEHLKLAIKLHHINEVVFFDHQDCGMFHSKFDTKDKPQEQRKLHVQFMKLAKQRILKNMKQAKENLKFTGYYMTLDGKITQLPLDEPEITPNLKP